MKILTIGPHIGDFNNEIMNFYPYVNWLSNVIDYDDIYIYIYENRSFLYDWIKKENKLYVDDILSRKELEQYKSINSLVSNDEFKFLVKEFKQYISNITGCLIKDIKHYNLPYTIYNFQIPNHNKIFEKIKTDIKIENKNKILYIPDKKNSKTVSEKIYNFLIKKYDDVLVIGDMKCHLKEYNILNREIDYFQNNYEYIIKHIEMAKLIICPNSHWALLANLYNKPLFTWGKNPAQFKINGLYAFNNKNVMSLPFDKKTPIDFLINTLNYFIKTNERNK